MPSSSPVALNILNLRKHFGEPAVDGLSLTVRGGEFYALLGPNGAGKTTTLRMVAGLLEADAGTVKICGIDAFADPGGRQADPRLGSGRTHGLRQADTAGIS